MVKLTYCDALATPIYDMQPLSIFSKVSFAKYLFT